MKLKIRKGASVKVIAGSEKGKTGTVLDVDSINMRIKVEGIKMLTKVNKQDGGFLQKEGYIHYSNVALIEAAKKKTSAKKSSKSKSA